MGETSAGSTFASVRICCDPMARVEKTVPDYQACRLTGSADRAPGRVRARKIPRPARDGHDDRPSQSGPATYLKIRRIDFWPDPGIMGELLASMPTLPIASPRPPSAADRGISQPARRRPARLEKPRLASAEGPWPDLPPVGRSCPGFSGGTGHAAPFEEYPPLSSESADFRDFIQMMTESAAGSRSGMGLARAVTAAALGVSLIWATWPTLHEMVLRWSSDSRYSHGYLVPFFAAVLLWLRAGDTDRPAARAGGGCPCSLSAWACAWSAAISSSSGSKSPSFLASSGSR